MRRRITRLLHQCVVNDNYARLPHFRWPHNFGGGIIHALNDEARPQSGQAVEGNCSPHCGHAAPVANVSKRCRQFPHIQSGPCGGIA